MSEAKTTAFKCPCGQIVDIAFYSQHVESGHKLHVIDIKGMDPVIATVKAPTPMVNIPYLGRLRRDAFLSWSIGMMILGALLAGYAWRIF